MTKRSGNAKSVRQSRTARSKLPFAKSPRAVVLVGFMGAGKTSVGRALGQRLNWLFEDLDDRIERRAGCTIAEIFRASGEPAFRDAEHEALREALAELGAGSKILALGGGAFVQPRNPTILKQAKVPVVFLEAPVEELWQRCRTQAGGAERPLLKDMDQFSQLHQSRSKHYAKAALRIATSRRSIEAIADDIIAKLHLHEVPLRTEQGEFE